MSDRNSKTVYRPPLPKYEGLALIVDKTDRAPNTAYKPLRRRGRGLELSADPKERRRQIIVPLAVWIAFGLAILYFGYLRMN